MSALHIISLGIFKRLFTLLEQECDKLDVTIANTLSKNGKRVNLIKL